MFLEIHNKKENDVVIYSQNIFDPDENFRIIYKDALQKKHQKIKYSDVCDFLEYPLPKNLIVYRLLTNYDAIKASDSKYGYLLYIDEKDELVYFDPIYALKDISNMVKDYNLQSFRFKIQQIGIRTLSYINERERFTEVYSYDLYAVEAQNQNDKIFADALFPEDPDLLNDNVIEAFSNEGNFNESGSLGENLKEDIVSGDVQFRKPSTHDTSQVPINKLEQKELLKKVLGIEETQGSGSVIKQVNLNSNFISDLENSNQYSDLFKKTTSRKEFEQREKDSIILKLTSS